MKEKPKGGFSLGDLAVEADETVPVKYTNFAKVTAQPHDTVIVFAHLTGVPGSGGFCVDPEGSASVRPSLILSMPTEVSAGLARAILIQLHKRGVKVEETLRDGGMHLSFDDAPEDES